MKTSIAACVLGILAQGALAQDKPAPILPEQLQWGGTPDAAQSVMVVGAPDKAGLYQQRVRMPAGSKIQPHTHPDERISVVLEGTIHVGFGETFDENEVVAIPAGAVYVAPAGVPHYVWAKDGPALYQEGGMGPTGAAFIPQAGQ
ncbi:MAG TPA: cupin domain-containing protein [Pseudomonadales bacterium]